jgi:hypothetical protein
MLETRFEIHGTGDPLLLLHGFGAHGPLAGGRWPDFVKTASAFLRPPA